MSDIINNREYRRDVLKQLISELHGGTSVDEVKQKFEETFSGVSATEISEVEQALIADGMPVAEVQRLCDVHAAVFKGSIEDHAPESGFDDPAHPAQVFKAENRAIGELIAQCIRPRLAALPNNANAQNELLIELSRLVQIEKHYQKKENLFFPYLEQYGITAPPKVMWGIDDEIRKLLKDAKEAVTMGSATEDIQAKAELLLTRVEEMIYKEENILLPMMMDALSPDEWKVISDGSGDFGYCLIDPPAKWDPSATRKEKIPSSVKSGIITLPTGSLQLEELIQTLNTLPFDITFVDRDDTVRYFSQGTDRIFARTNAVIGRKVTNCHPPASVHIVEKIVADFKSGAKDHEDFWIHMGSRFVLIRYFAVRSQAGEYMGTLEVTQDIAPIQAIEGEKRLLSE